MTLVELLEDEAKRLMRSVVNDSKYARHARADESRLRAESLRAHAARIRGVLAIPQGHWEDRGYALGVVQSLNSPLTAVSRG